MFRVMLIITKDETGKYLWVLQCNSSCFTHPSIERMTFMSEEEQQPQSVTLPIEWHVPDSIQSRYATNVLVQALHYEFIISFFETKLPPFIGQLEEVKAKFEQAGTIQAECIGRIIVAAEQLPSIINALQTSLEAYQAAREI